jgi:hypothetical protein
MLKEEVNFKQLKTLLLDTYKKMGIEIDSNSVKLTDKEDFEYLDDDLV